MSKPSGQANRVQPAGFVRLGFDTGDRPAVLLDQVDEMARVVAFWVVALPAHGCFSSSDHHRDQRSIRRGYDTSLFLDVSAPGEAELGCERVRFREGVTDERRERIGPVCDLT